MAIRKWISLILTLLVTSISTSQAADRYYYLGGSFGYSDLTVNDPASSFPPIYSIVWPGIPAINTDSYEVDDSDRIWKVYGGYRFNPYFGLEAGYTDLGTENIRQSSSYIYSESVPGGTDTTTQTYDADINTRLKGFELTAIARYPLNDTINIFAKFGGIRLKNTLERSATTTWSVLMSRSGFPDANQQLPTTSTSVTESDSGIDITFGLGAEYNITDAISFRGEWQQYRSHTQWGQYQTRLKQNVTTWNFGINYQFGS